MAFEDLYFISQTYGMLNLRYRPNDQKFLPSAGVADAQNIPGKFCVARVTAKFGHQVKRCYPAQKFSEMKPVLMHELRVSLAKIEPEIKRIRIVEQVLMTTTSFADILWSDFEEHEKTPTLHIQRSCNEMINAITHWDYEENLCSHTALAA